MKYVEHFRWWLPSRNPRGKPRLSGWLMDADEAAAQGALRPEPSTRVLRAIPETDSERQARFREMHGNQVSRPRWLQPEMIGLAVRQAPFLPETPTHPDLIALPVREVRWLDDYWAPAA